MAVTVSGTSITFNDATVQSTAATAPTTAQVLSATAAASVGAVGTYAFCRTADVAGNPGNANPGTTVSGSSLRYSNVGNVNGPTPAGTWRCMSYSPAQGGTNPDPYGPAWWQRLPTLFLRIS